MVTRLHAKVTAWRQMGILAGALFG